jgi:2-dehydro-3-deoxygluconokinase
MGEIMLRLSPPLNKRFIQAETFDIVYGGGEANVAVSLSQFGNKSYFVSKLPDNEIGQSAVNKLRSYGVDTSLIARGGDRIGIYFLEMGTAMRPSKVIYDRSNSAIAEAKAEDFDFDQIFSGKDWFHFSGITPALSKEAAKLTKLALISAKKHGLTVSCDLNYRKKLWTPQEAQSVMKDLMAYVDVCIGNEEDAKLVLGYELENTNIDSGELEKKDYYNLLERMHQDYNFKYIASTLRESYSASKNGWSAILSDGKNVYESHKFMIEPITDRVGGGDSFSAGLIHGLINYESQKAINFAAAASALKHTIFGDQNLVTVDEVLKIAGGNMSGRVER